MERKEQTTIVRKRRSQPSRRCKRLRFSGDAADHRLSLLDLPDAAIRYIIEFSAPENPNERWKWLNDMRATCRVFRSISKELVPKEFDLEQTTVPEDEDPDTYKNRITFEQQAPLLRSFLTAPWKGANLVKFVVSKEAARERLAGSRRARGPIVDALQSILRAPRLFPKLETLCIEMHSIPPLVDTQVLRAIGRNLPQLRRLTLDNCWSLGRIRRATFGAFGESLQQPLHTLSLEDMPWMREADIEEFLRRHRGSQNIRLLHLNRRGLLSDLTARAIAQHCRELEQISLVETAVTSSGLRSLLRANGDLKIINISRCDHVGADIVDVLVRHAPNLESLGVNYCQWFTDDCLMELIEGYQRSGSMSLRNLDIQSTSVTPAGLRRALEQAPDALVEQGSIYIGCTRSELLAEERVRWLFGRLAYAGMSREEWRSVVRDFPTVHFAELSLTQRLSEAKSA